MRGNSYKWIYAKYMNAWRLTVRERERLPRKKRVWYPGATYHVMSRGNRRTAIYKDKADYCHFLDIISMTMKEHAFRVHSICTLGSDPFEGMLIIDYENVACAIGE